MPYPIAACRGGKVSAQAGEPALARLLNLFKQDSGEVALYVQQASSPDYIYNFYQHLGGRRYWFLQWVINTTVGGNAVFLQYEHIVNYYRILHTTTAPAVTSSGTWTINNGTRFSGYLRCTSATPGNYVQLVTDEGTTSVGALCPAAMTNGMMHKVTIDGDATLADLLPTAQSLVDAGKLDAAALVANGGTLNPTDRIFDTYNRATAAVPFNMFPYQLFSTSLTAGQHTVQIIITPYKNTSSTGGWYVTGFLMQHSATMANITTGGPLHFFVPITQITPNNRVDELSYNTTPTGKAAAEWMGRTNSLKWKTAPTFTVDGGAVTPVVDVMYTGSSIAATMEINLKYSALVDPIGVYALTYTLAATTGLTIAHTITWAGTGTTMGYPFMLMVLHTTMDRFATLDYPAGADLAANNDSFNFDSLKQLAYCWDFDGYAGKMMYIPDLAKTVNSWAETSGNHLAWADDSAGTWKKAYLTRIGPGARAYANGEIMEAEANYRVQWFAGGANAALANIT